ncbi:MAG: peptidylprolyl isomerase [Gammaproteobacteria bacterium]|jgi:FKBP-type peptidyl-prolyl cis-trans isomerase SlyD
MIVDNNRVVSIAFTLTDGDGKTLDATQPGKPLDYLHGAENLLPGLEQALAGKEVGDSLTVTIAPEEGFGTVNPDLIQKVPAAAFQGVEKIEPGMAFEAKGPGGEVEKVVVEAVEGDQVRINANHPLAGVTLNFDVTVVAVREADEEEIAHGHVH